MIHQWTRDEIEGRIGARPTLYSDPLDSDIRMVIEAIKPNPKPGPSCDMCRWNEGSEMIPNQYLSAARRFEREAGIACCPIHGPRPK